MPSWETASTNRSMPGHIDTASTSPSPYPYPRVRPCSSSARIRASLKFPPTIIPIGPSPSGTGRLRCGDQHVGVDLGAEAARPITVTLQAKQDADALPVGTSNPHAAPYAADSTSTDAPRSPWTDVSTENGVSTSDR